MGWYLKKVGPAVEALRVEATMHVEMDGAIVKFPAGSYLLLERNDKDELAVSLMLAEQFEDTYQAIDVDVTDSADDDVPHDLSDCGLSPLSGVFDALMSSLLAKVSNKEQLDQPSEAGDESTPAGCCATDHVHEPEHTHEVDHTLRRHRCTPSLTPEMRAMLKLRRKAKKPVGG